MHALPARLVVHAQSMGSVVQAHLDGLGVRTQSVVSAVLTQMPCMVVRAQSVGSEVHAIGFSSVHTDGGFSGASGVGRAGGVHKVDDVHRVPTVCVFHGLNIVCGNVGGQ